MITSNGFPWLNDPDLLWAFPSVDPVFEPFGGRVLVQIRRVKTVTESGLEIVQETRETEKWNTQVGKVIAVGPLAFLNKETLEPWKEGVWAKVGDFVRTPKYGGDRFDVPVSGSREPALFLVCNDFELLGRITCFPLDVKGYLR